jgi:hypothetical protein
MGFINRLRKAVDAIKHNDDIKALKEEATIPGSNHRVNSQTLRDHYRDHCHIFHQGVGCLEASQAYQAN